MFDENIFLREAMERKVREKGNKYLYENLDALGPLSVLWSEADRISKIEKGMDPSDVFQFIQRTILFVRIAYFFYNSDRHKAILAKTMPNQ